MTQTHAQWEQTHPAHAAYERSLDVLRKQRGLQSVREFPCTGLLESIPGSAGCPRILACSVCNFEVADGAPVGEQRHDDEGMDW